jgi:hypothetical protein
MARSLPALMRFMSMIVILKSVVPAQAGTQVLRIAGELGFPPAREVISGSAGNDAL